MNFDEKSLMIYIRKAELRSYLNLFFLSWISRFPLSANVVCTTWMNEAKERNRVPWIFYSFHTVVSYSLLLTRNKEVWECIYYVGITFAIFNHTLHSSYIFWTNTKSYTQASIKLLHHLNVVNGVRKCVRYCSAQIVIKFSLLGLKNWKGNFCIMHNDAPHYLS